MNLEYNVDSPSTDCDHYDNLLLVPNGETGSARECPIQSRIMESRRTGRTCGARSRERQRQWQDTQRTRDRKKQECQTSFPFSLGGLEGYTHKLENALSLQIMAYQIAAANEADVEYAHLTIHSSRNVTAHQGKYYSDKSGYTRSGVDLPNGI